MSKPTLTLDANVVIGALDASDPAALKLLERARDGDFDVAVTTRVPYEVTRQAIPEWISALFVKPLGTPARYGVSTWDGGDYWAGAEQANIEGLDGDHVEGHIRAGRDLFVTSDKPLLGRLRARNIAALTPAEVLAKYPEEATVIITCKGMTPPTRD